ncbi:MAG: FKBP-type peptidyl-prolyl cis-trans isomerase [Acidobacteriota bacterium]
MIKLSKRLQWAALAVSIAAAGSALAATDLVTPPADAETRESGLVTVILEAGRADGRQPDANDLVAVHYTGYTTDGEMFRTTEGAEQPATFPLDRVFPGWREGIQLMKVGEKRRLWIPEHLGPSNPGAGPRASIFDVELVGVRVQPNPPPTLAAAPADALRMESGVRYVIVEEGKVDPEAEDADSPNVLLEYAVWNKEGQLIDGTAQRGGRPTAFQLDRVMPAFGDAVSEMLQGERRYVWMSEAQHGRQWPGSPEGPLVFELFLLRKIPAEMMQMGVDQALSQQ